MNGSAETLQTVFTKNRAEELGHDVWKNFVVPPFFEKLDLQQAKKPRMIVGGRGCGKTMLLRYLAHQSTFSPDRSHIPHEVIRHIGLYWRADTQFARMMWGRDVAHDVWVSAFNHLLALVFGSQFLKSVYSVARSNCAILTEEALAGVRFKAVSAYDPTFAGSHAAVSDAVETRFREFEVWVANVRRGTHPLFLPGVSFLKALIEEIKVQLPQLGEANYYAYIDEYENLHEYQQRIVNTHLKHSEMPLVFNIAIKRNGIATALTVGDESIIEPADYRTHDLEQYLLDGDFATFAAEVLFLSLAIAKIGSPPVDPRKLRDPQMLGERRSDEYRGRIAGHAREIFPGLSHEELARAVFEDGSLRRRLNDRFAQALTYRDSKLDADGFIRPSVPQASITALALVHRQRLQVEAILEQLDRLERGEDNQFTGKTDWVHNFFIGSLLSLYETHSRPCPFYAGFDAFCLMSRGNMRHFRELCHKSLNVVQQIPAGPVPRVEPGDQATAARQMSTSFLGEVRSFGRLGNQLHQFVLRLGSLFALAQRSKTQSEPERSHFSIVRGQAVTAEDHEFLREAVKWSVFFEEKETKVKDPIPLSGLEYVLNPIYAPYFGITYRKRRKVELSSEEFRTLREGTYDEVSVLLKNYAKKWAVDLPESDPTLFSHLAEGKGA